MLTSKIDKPLLQLTAIEPKPKVCGKMVVRAK